MRRLLMGSLNAGFRPESLALFARMTTPPTIVRQVAINNLVSALVGAGLSTRFIRFYVFAGADLQASSLNWFSTVGPAGPSGAEDIVFTADRGWAGQDQQACIAPAVFSATFTKDSHSFGAWVRTVGAGAGIMGMHDGSRFMTARLSGGDLLLRDGGSTSEVTLSGASLPGHIAVSRTDSAGFKVYLNGAEAASQVATLSVVPDDFFKFLAINAGGLEQEYSNSQLSAAYLADGLSAAEALVIHDALETYLTTVGAI